MEGTSIDCMLIPKENSTPSVKILPVASLVLESNDLINEVFLELRVYRKLLNQIDGFIPKSSRVVTVCQHLDETRVKALIL